MKRAGFLAILLLTLPVLAEQPAPALRPVQVPVIDGRSAEEYREGHVRDAVHIPYEQIADRITATVPNRDTRIVLYCRSGRRAEIAEKALRRLGYSHVENKGGLEDMRRAGYLTE